MDPLNDLGIIPIFYEINDDFTTNWKSLKKKCQKSVKAIVVINYFGFEEEKFFFKLFCKKKKLFLIEDNCHSLQKNIKKNKNYSDFLFSSIHKVIKTAYSGGLLRIDKNKKEKLLPDLNLRKYNVDLKHIINNFLENNFMIFKRFLKYKLLSMPNFSKLNSIKNKKVTQDFLIDEYSKSILKKKKINEIYKNRWKNYMIWKKICKKNKSKNIFKRKINKNNIPWVFPAYINDPKLRDKIFKFGWKYGYSITSWPSLPSNLIINRNKKKWNKLVCFNTDRAPKDKDIIFDNLIFKDNE